MRIVYGVKIIEEYCKDERFHSMLRVLEQAGRARKIADNLIEVELEREAELGICKSNDSHILALARAGNVRLLCTEDADLIVDFRSKSLIDNPRGNIYSASRHNHLLRRHCKSPEK